MRKLEKESKDGGLAEGGVTKGRKMRERSKDEEI